MGGVKRALVTASWQAAVLLQLQWHSSLSQAIVSHLKAEFNAHAGALKGP